MQSIPFNAENGFAITLDELHLQKLEVYSALRLGVQAQRNTTMLMISTAGDETSDTLHLLEQYGQEALLGQHENFGFFRWFSPDDYDIYDPIGLQLANPAVACGRLSLEKVLDGNKLLPEHEFTRYVLNRNGQSENIYLPANLWLSAGGETIPDTERKFSYIAIDRTLNWEYASIVAAKKIDGVVKTQLIAQIKNPTTDSLARICKQLYKKYRATFVMDAATLRELWKDLRERQNIPVEFYNSTQLAQATSVTYALLADERLKHANDPVMIEQRKHARTIAQNDGYKLSAKDSTGDIDSIKAMTIAVHKAETSERNKPTITVI